jgi:exopolysaccharide biosynthesis polyprenyl glycosylphosphotransferase
LLSRRVRRIVQHIGLLCLDAATAFAGFALAYWLRYDLQLGRAVLEIHYLPFRNFSWIGLTLVAILLILLEGRGLYRLPRGASWLESLSRIAEGSTLAVAILVVLLYATRTYYTRLLYVYAWFTITVAVAAGRAAVARVQRWLWRNGVGVERLLVVGNGPAGLRVMQSIRDRPDLGYFLVGYLGQEPEPADHPNDDEEPFRYLGRPEDLPLVLEPCRIDEVIIALPPGDHRLALDVANWCQQQGIDFRIAPDLFEMSFDRVDIAELAGIPLIGLKEVAIRGWNLVLKRALDIALSLFVLAVGWPLFLIIAIAIRLDSPGPVLFRQKRIGRRGRPFTLLKFRTMHANAEAEQERLAPLNEATGPLFKIRDDPRITRVGRVLRRTSLDELPQVFNILMGEMSWVGPRPGTPGEVAQYEPWHRKRLEVLPGLTGIWQVSGRSDLTFDEMVRLDLYYIENWNLWLDVVILLRTIPAVITGRGAY